VVKQHDDDEAKDHDDVESNLDSTQQVNETSRSRLRSLKSVTKHLLLFSSGNDGETLTVENIQKEMLDATENETSVMLLIINKLKPYIPAKQNRSVISYQLPFCLLANDILQSTGDSKFTRLLFPKSCPSILHALEMNASALYQMVTSEPNPLSITDFDNSEIDSIDYTKSNKDAVFCAIFDMAQIKKTCESYKLAFAHIIRVKA
jgi:hypothetical protein